MENQIEDSPKQHNFDIDDPSEMKNLRLSPEEDDIFFYSAIIAIAKRYFPATLAMYVEFGLNFSNLLFVASLDDSLILSGYGLGGFLLGFLSVSINVGLLGGLDTLVSQAYGRKDLTLCGTYLNTSRIIISILFFLQLLLLLNARTMFHLLGQPPESAKIAQNYINVLLPGVFFNLQFE
jgi:Na+-driven multidrug efflux pump